MLNTKRRLKLKRLEALSSLPPELVETFSAFGFGGVVESYGSQYGSGVFPASGGAEGYMSNLQNRYWTGSSFKGTTIWPRHLGTPKDSPALRHRYAEEAVKEAQDTFEKILDIYSGTSERYSAVKKVLDALTSHGLAPNYVRWEKNRLNFEIDFLDASGVRQVLLGIIKVEDDNIDFRLTGELKLAGRRPGGATPRAAPGQIRVGSGKNP